MQLCGEASLLKKKRNVDFISVLLPPPLSDDLTDSARYDAKAILTAWDKRSNDNSSAEIVAGRYLYNKLLENANPGFAVCSARALEAQDESMGQTMPELLSFHSLQTITFKKGAASIMLGRSMLCIHCLQVRKKPYINSDTCCNLPLTACCCAGIHSLSSPEPQPI